MNTMLKRFFLPFFKATASERYNFKVFNFNPKATRTYLRDNIFPAENPNQLKEVKELMPYYIWMLSENSNDSIDIHIEYGDEL